MTTRRICVVLTTRGNYTKMKSAMRRIAADPALELRTVVGGALLGGDYGPFRAAIERDGFTVSGTLDYIVGRQTPADIAESAGRCTARMGRVLGELRPDVLFVIADRYEALAVALAGVCMNVRIAHLEGGEVSGSIDERIRHAITKLAHLHFPANTDAAERLRRMGEREESIFVVGTPSLDLLAEVDLRDRSRLAHALGRDGQGAAVDVEGDYVVVSQHPVVTEYADAPRQFAETAKAVREIGLPVVWLLPNDDAGATAAGPALESLARGPKAPPVRRIAALAMAEYAVLLRNARCLIGNSSSGLREGAFLGVPAVNIGTRQTARQRGANVIDVGHDAGAISAAARRQMAHGRYPSDPVYGDGRAGEKIARVLAETRPALDKTIAY